MIKKKVIKKKTIQSKKEYPVVVQKKPVQKETKIREVLEGDPDAYMSVCFTRADLFRIKQKMKEDPKIVDHIDAVLKYIPSVL